jgi:hypothetical protein
VDSVPIILFKGVEDRTFLHELLTVMNVRGNFDFQKGEGRGKDQFKLFLEALVTANRKAIIIVADNDGNPAEAFKNIQKQIGEAGFTVPTKPRELVQTAGLSPLSVLMIPWDNEAGCLETLGL